jgi:hypothetical protein
MRDLPRDLATTVRKGGYIFQNVRGVRFSIGENVRVCQLVDQTGASQFLGARGTIQYFEYRCGCGQSYPHDPMIGVRFSNGEVEEFWSEELETARRVGSKVWRSGPRRSR